MIQIILFQQNKNIYIFTWQTKIENSSFSTFFCKINNHWNKIIYVYKMYINDNICESLYSWNDYYQFYRNVIGYLQNLIHRKI